MRESSFGSTSELHVLNHKLPLVCFESGGIPGCRERNRYSGREEEMRLTLEGVSQLFACSRRELVHAAVVVCAAMHSGAIKISESIDDHAIVRKATIRRACERMYNSFRPLAAANRT
jgi:hypothetical protein